MVRPKVSVLMAVHNSAQYLSEAVESILRQTWRDFEFIIIDDGSTDATGTLLLHYQQRDSRVQVHHQSKQGLTAALNRGLMLACGEYVARMDADDISLPRRLVEQVAFLDARPEVAVCGTWVRAFGGGRGLIWRYPLDDASIGCYTVFGNPFAHPSVMMRRRMFEEAQLLYDPSYRYSQDYDLWARAIGILAMANIPKVLLLYRQHATQVRSSRGGEQDKAAARVRGRQLAKLGLLPSAGERALHEAVSLLKFTASRQFITEAESWLCRLRSANAATHAYPEPAFSVVVGQQWYRVCSASASLGPWVIGRFQQSSLTTALAPAWRYVLRLAAKMLVLSLERPATRD